MFVVFVCLSFYFDLDLVLIRMLTSKHVQTVSVYGSHSDHLFYRFAIFTIYILVTKQLRDLSCRCQFQEAKLTGINSSTTNSIFCVTLCQLKMQLIALMGQGAFKHCHVTYQHPIV
jgi:hypothetical protein